MTELTVVDYKNILVLLANAPYSGIQGAATGVSLYNKIQTIISEKEANGGKSTNAPDSVKPSVGEPS